MEIWSEEAPHVIDIDDLASKFKCPFICGTKAQTKVIATNNTFKRADAMRI